MNLKSNQPQSIVAGNQCKPTALITVFARRERTTDTTTLQLSPQSAKQDVVIYRDRECRQPMGRFPWHLSCRPTRSNQRVVLNCWTWKLEWLADLTGGSLNEPCQP